MTEEHPAQDAPADDPPLTTLKGVGPHIAKRLTQLGLYSVGDVLFHLPRSYLDRSQTTPFAQVNVGQFAAVEGLVESATVTHKRRRMLLVQLRDDSGPFQLRFLYFSGYHTQQFAVGTRIRAYGEVRGGVLPEMIHPEFRDAATDHGDDQALTPIYPSTQGLTQTKWRELTQQALAWLDTHPLADDLTADWQQRLRWPTLSAALHYVHRPPLDADRAALLERGDHPARRRLVFDELLAHQLSLRQARQAIRAFEAPALTGGDDLIQAFLARLPFALTGAQQRVFAELDTDLRQTLPMLRLVQGDVGSGKTVVACLAALRAIGAGYQAAVMAPTELLADQHLRNFTQWLDGLGGDNRYLKVVGLTGRKVGKARRRILEDLALGTAQLAVGTHALFQEKVDFARLGLVIVDEQHRFGVHQRLSLRDKGAWGSQQPHQLVMTATPIPRTLYMTSCAHLDVSIIDELPPGRTPIRTVALAESRRDEVIMRLQENCAAGRQAYWVCPLIEESEVLDCRAAEVLSAELRELLPTVRVGLIHGRLKGADKAATMAAFKAHELDLLVATTVIEVGVDVPNASIMVIDNAERLGLSQLHQLRGRVGRGSAVSHCVLLYKPPLSWMARARLAAMRDTTDGFVIAQKDLELRGPGEILGTKQTGELQFHIADLNRDGELVDVVRTVADELLQQAPDRVPALIARWIGQGVRYSQV